MRSASASEATRTRIVESVAQLRSSVLPMTSSSASAPTCGLSKSREKPTPSSENFLTRSENVPGGTSGRVEYQSSVHAQGGAPETSRTATTGTSVRRNFRNSTSAES